MLSDPGNAFARQLSLAFELPHDLREIYRAFEIDLAEFDGDESWELPLPARIVVDAAGVIRAIEANPDYSRRPEPHSTVEELRALIR